MRRSYQRSLCIALCALLPFAFSAVSVAAPKITGESTKTTTKKTTKKTTTTTTKKRSGKTTTKKRSTTTTKKRSTTAKKAPGLKRPTKPSKRGAGSMKRKESVKRSSTVGGAKTKPAKRSSSKRPSAPRATGGKSITEKAPAKRGGFGQQKQAPRDSLRDPKGPKVRAGEQGSVKRVGPAKRAPAKRGPMKRDPAVKGPTKRPTAPRKEPGVKGVREVHDDQQRPHPQDDHYHEDGHYHEQQPQQEQPYYEERRPAPAPAPAYAPPPPPPCRPTGDKIMLNAGVGFEATDGIDSNNMAFVLGGGLRSGFLGVAGEAHFNQSDEGSELSAFAGQLRLYLPVGTCANLYPLAGVSQQNLGAADVQKDASTYAFDVGAGFDLNIGGALALGVRYTRSFFSEDLSLTNTNTSGHRDTFIAQLSVFF